MPFTLLSAVLSAFFLVRILKGPWFRHPHYLGLAIIGSIAGKLLVASFAPDLASGMVAGSLAPLIGAAIAIMAFDRVTDV
ncbi:MAG: hypothetical protein R3D65_11375 [Zhengella sp.]|uniref:hypothetical protein n=1 Tax=Zhengella sp. TaxID=2282762 RepID=UPI003526C8D2|nr:hypothetical protein [Brucellaceae bacterium]